MHNNKSSGNKIGVLWQGATYNAIGIAPEQAQFLQTRKFSADQICKFYGVPPAIIGDYEHSKFATADAMIRAFVMITLRNLCQRIEDAVYRQVLCVRGDNGRLRRAFGNKRLIYKFVLEGLTRGDAKSQAETHKVYREMGVQRTNEIRDDIGLNPLEGPEVISSLSQVVTRDLRTLITKAHGSSDNSNKPLSNLHRRPKRT